MKKANSVIAKAAAVVLWCAVAVGCVAEAQDEVIKPSDPRVFSLIKNKNQELCGFVLSQINEGDQFDSLRGSMQPMLGLKGVTLPDWRPVKIEEYEYIFLDSFRRSEKKYITENKFIESQENLKNKKDGLKVYLSKLDIDNNGSQENILLQEHLDVHAPYYISSLYILNNDYNLRKEQYGPYGGRLFFYGGSTYFYSLNGESGLSIYKYIPLDGGNGRMTKKSICVFEIQRYL